METDKEDQNENSSSGRQRSRRIANRAGGRRRGHTVLAIARKPEAIAARAGHHRCGWRCGRSAGAGGLIAGSDAVISALHFDIPAATLLQALKLAGVGRLLVMGAGLRWRQGSG
jgi:putative NADH-flavin reductase